MRVGLTYDLRDDYLALGGFSETALAEFDSPETIDALEHALTANGCRVERIGHIRSLAGRLVAGESWDLVFNIRSEEHTSDQSLMRISYAVFCLKKKNQNKNPK